MTITSPSGTVVTLTTDNGGGNDNVFNGTMSDDKADPGNQMPFSAGTFAASNLVTDTTFTNLVVKTNLVPEEALAAFQGENPNGVWSITILDDAGGDTPGEWVYPHPELCSVSITRGSTRRNPHRRESSRDG